MEQCRECGWRTPHQPTVDVVITQEPDVITRGRTVPWRPQYRVEFDGHVFTMTNRLAARGFAKSKAAGRPIREVDFR